MARPPLIVLAFANEQEARRYLRDLPEEFRQLRRTLEDAERNGLCRLEVLPNATLDQIFDVFTRTRNEVAIFHYAGHTNSGGLLLESSAVGGSSAHASGLATFLGQLQGLQLVFLNGCATRGQVDALLGAGVPAVIATTRDIDDSVAREFAVAFYTELASGASLHSAYEAARGRVMAAGGNEPRTYINASHTPTTPADIAGFPWELRFRSGAELVARWSLPDAAGDPLFGLPTLPEQDLPLSPFQNLNPFRSEHAEIFFGRDTEIRELYDQATDWSGPPILLLYGGTGVGKSSLLAAGLVPRLMAGGYKVRYVRREPQKGLLRTLVETVPPGVATATLGDAWRSEEHRLGKPLVLIVDRVEEVFTLAVGSPEAELREFASALVAALGRRDERPRGKLVLAFRREWLAELERTLTETRLPHAKFSLGPLRRAGVIEATIGPARPGRLQRYYRLAVEDGLPERIADDLMADSGSALAPTLQVMLTKMWERVRGNGSPRFDRALYEGLKSAGYLLTDIVDQGLREISRWNPEVADSGLALDFLEDHTTPHGTAAIRTRAELERRYPHRADVLGGLIALCVDLHLIIDGVIEDESATFSTRLAHDQLAPLVSARFRQSMAPGQVARRLLESRGLYKPTAALLDGFDLGVVESGAPGMRAWTADEAELVGASRRAEAERQQQVATLKRHAEASALAQRLITASGLVVLKKPQRSLLLVVEAVRVLRENGLPVGLPAEQALRNALSAVQCQVFAGSAGAVSAMAVSNDGMVAAGKEDGTFRVWDLDHPQAASVGSRAGEDRIGALAFTATGRLVIHDAQGLVRVWELNRPAVHASVLREQVPPVNRLVLGLDGRLITGEGDGKVREWDLGPPSVRVVSSFPQEGLVCSIAVLTGPRFATGDENGIVRVWNRDRPGDPPVLLRGHDRAVAALTSSSEDRVATGGDDGLVLVWDLARPKAPLLALRGQECAVATLAFAGDDHLVVRGDDGSLRVWDVRQPTSPPLTLCRKGECTDVLIDADGRLVAGRSDGTVWVRDVSQPDADPIELRGHEGAIVAMAFTPDGRLITSGGDGSLRVWEIGAQRLIEGARTKVRRNLSRQEWWEHFPQDEPYRRTFPDLSDGPSRVEPDTQDQGRRTDVV